MNFPRSANRVPKREGQSKITVVGLGPADESLLTNQTVAAIKTASRRFLRTRRHPAASLLADAVAFDDEYEIGESFEAVYRAISDRLLREAATGDLLYAVPGSPLVLERTVELLREATVAADLQLEVLPAMSFLDVAWSRLGIDPITSGVRLVDAQRFAVDAAGQRGPFLLAHCYNQRVLSEVKLAVDEEPESAVVLQRLGLPDEAVFEVAWSEIDREINADHLTSLWIPELAEPLAGEFVRFEELVRELRERCVWDQAQTHGSLRKHFLEESYEVLEALDGRASLDDSEVDANLDSHLVEELGDLLYQVFFHARIGAERGSFTVTDIVRTIHDKLVTRHPHVFADQGVVGVGQQDAEVLARRWEEIKRQEKGRVSAMDGVQTSLPALLLAAKVQDRSINVGFDAAHLGPIGDKQTGNNPYDRVGELLFALVSLCREFDVDAEAALRAVTVRFMQSVRQANK